MNRHSKDDLNKLIIGTLATISPNCASSNPSTILLGDSAVVDSVGFVNLLIALEQNLGGNVDLSSSFMEHGDAEEGNPFRTVGSLVEHIQELETAHA